jgi:hypothetical protein
MQIRDLMQEQGQVFLKSEWGPIGDGWPCVSFTKKSVGEQLRNEFVPGRDVLIYVGTTSPENTPDKNHRSHLLSAVVIEPKQILETRKFVPAAVWQQSVEKYGADKWTLAMPVTKAAQLEGPPFPHAHDVAPTAYRSFADIANRGGVVKATAGERTATMDLAVRLIELKLTPEVRAYADLRATLSANIDIGIKQQAYRMANLIRQRVTAGGDIGVRVNPLRSSPSLSDLIVLIQMKWIDEQKGKCALCSGDLPTTVTNKMLQPSADRIDSANGTYEPANLQITHLACNWAKNEYGAADFADWLQAIRRST